MDITIGVTGNSLPETREYIEQVVRQVSNQPIVEINSLADVWTEMYDDENQSIFLQYRYISISDLLDSAGQSCRQNLKCE